MKPVPRARKIHNPYNRPKPPVRSFVPPGCGEYVIYAVELTDHPGVVKVGRSSRWRHRRIQYANFNLRAGDAIERERAFVITDEYVDLAGLEAAVLDSMDFPRRHGLEWFHADFEDVCRIIDRVLCANEISYI